MIGKNNGQKWLRNNNLYSENESDPKKITLDMFERMLDCTDKYAGEHRLEPTVVRVSFYC